MWDGIQDMEIGVVVRLDTRSMALEYFGLEPPIEQTGRLDLMTESGLYLSCIPYEIVYSEPAEEEQEPSPVPICRSFLRFGPLTPIQQTAIETLIVVYTESAG